MTTFDLLLIGHGNVAKRFVSLLEERRAELARQHGIRARVIGIATRRDGCRYIASGSGGTGPAKAGHYLPARVPAVDFISDACARNRDAAREGRLVVVETTTLDVERGEPAISHVRSALAGGAHAITTNKGPAAFAYRSLLQAADRAGRRFLFEGAVMDGVPIFNLVRETLPAVDIVGFRGVINSTTNHILSALEEGESFDAALDRMQSEGIAEADPSLDLDGWDAAAKTSALANVLMRARMTPQAVDREGIGPSTARAAMAAKARGGRVRLVASARQGPAGVTTSVRPVELPETDLLAGLRGIANAIVLQTDLLGEIAICQLTGGLTQTAYALLSDLITIRRRTPPAPHGAAPGRSL